MKQVVLLLALIAIASGLPAPQRFDGPRDWSGDRFRDLPPQRSDWRWNDDDWDSWRRRHHHRPQWVSPDRPYWDRRPEYYPERIPPGFFLGNVIGGLLSGASGNGIAPSSNKVVPVRPNSGPAQAVGLGTASVNNGAATATGVGIASAPSGGIGIGLGIGGAVSTPFGSTAFGSGQSIAVGR